MAGRRMRQCGKLAATRKYCVPVVARRAGIDASGGQRARPFGNPKQTEVVTRYMRCQENGVCTWRNTQTCFYQQKTVQEAIDTRLPVLRSQKKNCFCE
jgi:hypothetical protein